MSQQIQKWAVLVSLVLLSGCQHAMTESKAPSKGAPPPTDADMRENNAATIHAEVCIYAQAVKQGDVELARAFLWANNDPNRAIVGAYAKYKIACALMQRNLETKLMGKSSDFLSQHGIELFDFYGLVISEWEVNGDQAKSKVGPDIELRKINEIWKIDVTPKRGESAESWRKQAESIAAVSADLASGKYVTYADVDRALSAAGIVSKGK